MEKYNAGEKWPIDRIEGESTHDFGGYEKKEFFIWKTVSIGTGEKDGKEMADTLSREGFYVSGSSDRYGARDILDKVEFGSSPEQLDLVRVTPADLGFKEMPSLKAVIARAQELGLNLCPAEVGPRLRLAYKDQSKDDWINVGMVPIIDSDGRPIIFSIIEEDGLYLHSNYNSEVQVYNINRLFVFIKGDKKYYDPQPE
jgi:hypothetical protein